jgi:hypothetical protein
MAGRMGVLKEIEDLPDVNEIGRAQASQQTQAMTRCFLRRFVYLQIISPLLNC